MKKATIARFVIGLAAISAVGCSAETGAPGVGESSQALSGTAPALLTGGSDPTSLTASQSPAQERFFGTSCKFANAGVEYYWAAGGYDASGLKKSGSIISTAGGAWTAKATITARGELKSFRIDDTHCLLLAGSTVKDSTDSAVVELATFTFPGSVPTVTITSEHALGTARSKFEVSSCTDSNGKLHAVVFGGGQPSGELDDMEVSPALDVLANLSNAWTPTSAVFSTGRTTFGLAKEPGQNYYFVAGGDSTGAARDATIDLIKLDGNCALASTTQITTSTKILENAVDGNVAFPEGTANTFVVTGGRKAGLALWDKADTFLVNWTNSTITSRSSASLTQGYRPTLLDVDPTSSHAIMLLGGSDENIANMRTTVNEYQTGFGWVAAGTALTTANYGGTAQLFAGPKVILATGASALSGGTYTLPVDVIGYTP